MPLFLHDDGRLLLPTARRIWDELLSAAVVIRGYLEGDEARRIFDRLMEAAEAHGKPLYTELLALHRERLTRERDKGEYAFMARPSRSSGSACQRYVITGLPSWSGRNMPGGSRSSARHR